MIEKIRYCIPTEIGGIRAVFLAVLMHVVLFFFLCIETHCSNTHSVVVNTEIWSPETIKVEPSSTTQLIHTVKKLKSATPPLHRKIVSLKKEGRKKSRRKFKIHSQKKKGIKDF